MSGIPPFEAIRQDLRELLSAVVRTSDTDPLYALICLVTRLVLQEALAAEQADFLGRGRYQREGSQALQ